MGERNLFSCESFPIAELLWQLHFLCSCHNRKPLRLACPEFSVPFVCLCWLHKNTNRGPRQAYHLILHLSPSFCMLTTHPMNAPANADNPSGRGRSTVSLYADGKSTSK